MAKKIAKIPKQLEDSFPDIVKRAIQQGLCCEPADKLRAETALRKIYSKLNLNPNVPIIWVDSPLVGALAASISLSIFNKENYPTFHSVVHSTVEFVVDSAVQSAVHYAVHSAVDSAVYSAVNSAVNSAVYSAVDSAVQSAVHSTVYSADYSAVHSAVHSAVDSAVDSAVQSAVHSTVDSVVNIAVFSAVYSAVHSAVHSAVNIADYSAVYSADYSAVNSTVKSKNLKWVYWRGGQFWISWNVYVNTILKMIPYDPVFDICELEYEVAQSAGYYWPTKNFIMICERPKYIKMDNQGRLHNEVGPSISYGPTFELYSWHGTTIPYQWIKEKDKLGAKTAITWSNIEQRRAACEILGWNNILKELKAVTIDKDGDSQIGELLEVDIPDIGKEKFLRVLCGTGREFAIPVPPNMKTALEAQSWTWGLDTSTFIKPEVRT